MGAFTMILFLLSASTARAEFFVGKGATGASFLKIPLAARPAALGGTFTAGESDAAAMEYNPAGLNGMDRVDINATYISYIEDSSLQSLSAGFPMGNPLLPRDQRRFTMGVHYRTFHSESLGRNNIGAPLDTFSIRDQMAEAAASYKAGPRLALGLGGKYIRQSLADESLTNFAMDAGALWKFNQNTTFGLSLLNLGPSKAFIDEKDPLPTQGRAGLAFHSADFLILADTTAGRDKVFRQSAGLEWTVNPYLAIRGGALFDTDIEFTGGLGIRFNGPDKRASDGAQSPAAPERTPPSANEPANDSNVIVKKLSDLADDLSQQYGGQDASKKNPSIAVLPFASEVQRIGPIVTELLHYQFMQQRQFTVIDRPAIENAVALERVPENSRITVQKASDVGKRMSADAVVLGEIISVEDDKYTINARLINPVDGKVLGAAYRNFEWSGLNGERSPAKTKPAAGRHTLEAVRSSSPAREPGYTSVDIGLDYAVRTRNDLGLSHTVSIRILY